MGLSRLGAATIVTCLCSSLIGQTSDAKARDLLAKSMMLGRSIPITGVIRQRMKAGSQMLFNLRIEQGDGKVKLTVLSPLSFQGVTTLDDGQRWTTFLPDENRLLVQPSPRLTMGDPRFRMKLAEKNYRFKFEKASTIAGRQAVAVLAEPKSGPVPSRRYSFDQQTLVLLRLETTGPYAEQRILFDTAEIAFPDEVRSDVFALRTVGAIRKMEYDSPIKFTSPDVGKKLVGFEPILPKKLPFGFVIQECQVTGPKTARFFAIRLTDGLISATVYQWDGEKQTHDLPGASESWRAEADGVQLQIAGEIPEELGEALLAAFFSGSGRRFVLFSHFGNGPLVPFETSFRGIALQ